MRYKVITDHNARGETLFFVVDLLGAPIRTPRFVGTFAGGAIENQLARLGARALNQGASLFFVGIEERPNSMLFHMKRQNGAHTQSVLTPALGRRLIARLRKRHPLAIVDFWSVMPELTSHKIFHAATIFQDEIPIEGDVCD